MIRSIGLICLMLGVLQLGSLQAQQLTPVTTCGDGRIAYSTYIGGSLQEDVARLAVDTTGKVYIAGTSFSSDFLPARNERHGVDATLVGLTANGQSLAPAVWVNPATQNDEDDARAVALDAQGNLYFGGRTRSGDFCAALATDLPGFDTSYNGGTDGFIVKLDSSGTPVYCTYIGGDDLDIVRGLAVTAGGSVIATGDTVSGVGFPTTTGVTPAGSRDAFVLRLSGDGQSLDYSTLLGGSGQEAGVDIALDGQGEAIVTGWTSSSDLPTTAGAAQTTAGGDFDGFIMRLSNDGLTRRFVTYLGGDSEDRPTALAYRSGAIGVTGFSSSDDLPTTANAFDSSYNGSGGFGDYDGFLMLLSDDGASLSYGSYLGGAASDQAFGIDLRAADDILLIGSTRSSDFPTTNDAVAASLSGGSDLFITQLTPASGTPAFSSYFGGTRDEVGRDLQLANDGYLYFSGETNSTDFCTTAGVYDNSHNGDFDMAVVKLFLGLPTGQVPPGEKQLTVRAWLPLITR